MLTGKVSLKVITLILLVKYLNSRNSEFTARKGGRDDRKVGWRGREGKREKRKIVEQTF